MYCTNCGTQLQNEAKFCSNCGQMTKIEVIQSDNTKINDDKYSDRVCKTCKKQNRQIYLGLEPTNKFVCNVHDITPGVCPICNNKLRTDKAEQCSKCQASWRTTKPTDINSQPTNYYSTSKQIRCPKCSSTQIHIDRKGIGVKRALLGGAVLGPLGLIFGASGRKKIEASCLNCGKKWYT